MQISDQLIEHLMIAARGIAWDKGVTVSEAEIARQHTRQVLETALSAAEPVEQDGNPMRFFSGKVDNWGALEWFNRMADACEDHDRKRRIMVQCADEEEKDILEISANTSKMVMTSSAFHLARECKDVVVAALSAQVQDVAMVTRESAINALKHLYAHNGSGRYTDAIAMLAAAPAKQEGGHD